MSTLNNFNCRRCGKHNLAYEKYVKCVEPVNIKNDGHIEYAAAIIDQDNALGAEFGYVCADCGHLVYHCGRRIETEKELIDYLTAPPDKLAEEERLFEAYEKEVAAEQEEEERIESYTVEAEISEN